MPEFHLVSEPNASLEDTDIIREAIYEFNMAKMDDRNFSSLNIFLRDDSHTLFGGILGDIWGGYLHITFLWIKEELRNQGYGKRLLQAAEQEAREKACRAAFLETHSFQAPDFYLRNGFRIVGEIPDYPPGQSFFILWKLL